VSETVESTLGKVSFDAQPNDQTAGAEVDRAVLKATEAAQQLVLSGDIPSSRIADLMHVFDQSLRNTIAPNFDARCDMMRARGDTWAGRKLDSERESWTKQAELTRNARFSIDQLEVRVLYKSGVRVAIEVAKEGYSTVMSRPKPGRLPIAKKPDEGKLDVIEVRLPMEKRTVAIAGKYRKQSVLVGYQFAWSKKRNQWIPWLVCQYTDPGDVHYAIYY